MKNNEAFMALFPIKISVTSSQLSPVEKWAYKFNNSSLNRFSDAVVINSKLEIDAMHLCDFLRIANESESNQFDVHRLKTQVIMQVTASLKRRTTKFSIRGLQAILEELREVQVGEWRDVDFNELKLNKPGLRLADTASVLQFKAKLD
jgi:hypothetical protein